MPDSPKDIFRAQADPAQARKDAGKLHALWRIGKPEEVGRVAVFLASEDASLLQAHPWWWMEVLVPDCRPNKIVIKESNMKNIFIALFGHVYFFIGSCRTAQNVIVDGGNKISNACMGWVSISIRNHGM